MNFLRSTGPAPRLRKPNIKAAASARLTAAACSSYEGRALMDHLRVVPSWLWFARSANRAGHALPAARPSHPPNLLLLHISLHFEADLQFDITGNAVLVGFLVAPGFCAGSKLFPFRLKF